MVHVLKLPVAEIIFRFLIFTGYAVFDFVFDLFGGKLLFLLLKDYVRCV
jgi:hypothetical protein